MVKINNAKGKDRKIAKSPEGVPVPYEGPNWFADPVIGSDKETFLEYCVSILGLDKAKVGKWVSAKFGKIDNWSGSIALQCLAHTYERAMIEAGHERMFAHIWAVPKICPLCGSKTMIFNSGLFPSSNFVHAWGCVDDEGNVVHQSHCTWPLAVVCNERAMKSPP